MRAALRGVAPCVLVLASLVAVFAVAGTGVDWSFVGIAGALALACGIAEVSA